MNDLKRNFEVKMKDQAPSASVALVAHDERYMGDGERSSGTARRSQDRYDSHDLPPLEEAPTERGTPPSITTVPRLGRFYLSGGEARTPE